MCRIQYSPVAIFLYRPVLHCTEYGVDTPRSYNPAGVQNSYSIFALSQISSLTSSENLETSKFFAERECNSVQWSTVQTRVKRVEYSRCVQRKKNAVYCIVSWTWCRSLSGWLVGVACRKRPSGRTEERTMAAARRTRSVAVRMLQEETSRQEKKMKDGGRSADYSESGLMKEVNQIYCRQKKCMDVVSEFSPSLLSLT